MPPRSSRRIASVSFRVVLSGTCRITPDPGSEHSFPELVLGPGDMALFGPNVGHTLTAAGLADQTGNTAESLYCGYLQDRRQPHPLLRDLANITYIPVRGACPIEFESLLRFLRLELADSEQLPDLTPALVEASLTYVLRTWHRHHAHDASSPHTDDVVARALRSMHAHIEYPWTVAELAAVAGLSRAAFAHRFTTAIGQPPLAYLTSVRLAEAAKLLRETDRPITQIARVTGYSSTITLTRAFRREQGVTPGAYRHEQTLSG
nr:AraC family transcriptional regulator [Nocardia transvalensis]